MKYTLKVIEVSEAIIEVEADDMSSARVIAEQMWENGEINVWDSELSEIEENY